MTVKAKFEFDTKMSPNDDGWHLLTVNNGKQFYILGLPLTANPGEGS